MKKLIVGILLMIFSASIAFIGTYIGVKILSPDCWAQNPLLVTVICSAAISGLTGFAFFVNGVIDILER